MNKSYLDVLAMILLPIIASVITLVLETNLFVSVLLFFALPALYLGIRKKRIVKKSIIFSLLLSVPLSLFIDVIAAVNGSWVVPETVFPFKLFGVATMEVYLYGFFWVLSAVLFYERFFDNGKSRTKTSPHIYFLLYLSVILIAYTSVGFLLYEPLLFIPYFYFWCGIILVVIPWFVFLYYYPEFIRRHLVLTAYFFFLLFIFEIVALEVGQWIFPAQDFIGLVKVFGFQFPIEELFIWMIAATPALLSYYEFFDDDRVL